MRASWVLCLALVGCGDDSTIDDAGTDATFDAFESDAALDGSSLDAPADAFSLDAEPDIDADADDAGGSAVSALCLEVSSRWRAGGDASDDSRECDEVSAAMEEYCPELPDLCLDYWMCMDESSSCRGGNPDVGPSCFANVEDPEVPGRTIYCITGESSDPPPITGPGDQACRNAGDTIEALELACFGAGGGLGDRFCARMADSCEGYWNCVAGSAECDEELHAVVWGDSCDDLAEPDGFDCRLGR